MAGHVRPDLARKVQPGCRVFELAHVSNVGHYGFELRRRSVCTGGHERTSARTKNKKNTMPDSMRIAMTRSHFVLVFEPRRRRPIVRRYCLRRGQKPTARPLDGVAHQVLYEIINVAAPVVASVVQYDASWTFLQNGGFTKSPIDGSSTSLTTQKVINPDVAKMTSQGTAFDLARDSSPKEPAKNANGMRRSQRSFPVA